jgi:hypothetical protein
MWRCGKDQVVEKQGLHRYLWNPGHFGQLSLERNQDLTKTCSENDSIQGNVQSSGTRAL